MVRHHLLLAAALLLVCEPALGEEGRHAPQDALLLRAAEQYSRGYLEEAWNTSLEFYRHPGRNVVDPGLFGICFVLGRCPDVGQLQRVLGRSRREAEAMRGFCPNWSEWPNMNLRAGEESWESYFDWYVPWGLHEPSCEDWYETILAESVAVVDHRGIVSGSASVDMQWEMTDPEVGRPLVRAWVGEGSEMSALVDTGATSAMFLVDQGSTSEQAWEEVREQGYEFLRSTSRIVTAYGLAEARVHRLPDPLSLEGVEYSSVVGIGLDPKHFPFDFPVDPSSYLILGQSLLLRHPALCFDWVGEKLHLGELGPCAAGVRIDDAALRLGLGINLSVPTRIPREEPPSFGHPELRDTRRMEAALDTGSDITTCSQKFVSLNGGSREFQLSEHADLTGFCAAVVQWSPIFGNDLGYGGLKLANIGMDTLLQFRAFGWELSPLRLYFVPYGEETQAPEAPSEL